MSKLNENQSRNGPVVKRNVKYNAQIDVSENDQAEENNERKPLILASSSNGNYNMVDV